MARNNHDLQLIGGEPSVEWAQRVLNQVENVDLVVDENFAFMAKLLVYVRLCKKEIDAVHKPNMSKAWNAHKELTHAHKQQREPFSLIDEGINARVQKELQRRLVDEEESDELLSPAVPPVKNFGWNAIYRAEVVDKKKFVKAAMNGELSDELAEAVRIDMKPLNKIAKSLKEVAHVPGVEFKRVFTPVITDEEEREKNELLRKTKTGGKEETA